MKMIKPAVPYALETWKFSVRDIKNLLVSERKNIEEDFWCSSV